MLLVILDFVCWLSTTFHYLCTVTSTVHTYFTPRLHSAFTKYHASSAPQVRSFWKSLNIILNLLLSALSVSYRSVCLEFATCRSAESFHSKLSSRLSSSYKSYGEMVQCLHEYRLCVCIYSQIRLSQKRFSRTSRKSKLFFFPFIFIWFFWFFYFLCSLISQRISWISTKSNMFSLFHTRINCSQAFQVCFIAECSQIPIFWPLTSFATETP